MQAKEGKKKRVFVIEAIDSTKNLSPKISWNTERFYVCQILEADMSAGVIHGPATEDDAFKFASNENFEWVSDPDLIDLCIDPGFDGCEDFAHEITVAVLDEVGLSIVEIVIYQKNGMTSPRQLKAAFWVVPVRSNGVITVHATLRAACAKVSKEYEALLAAKYPDKVKRRKSASILP